MKTKLSILRPFAMIVASLVVVNGVFAADAGSPVIVFDEQHFDFGKIDQGASVSHEFWFQNQSKTQLVLQDVASSCGCTGALPDRKEIPPGERSKISVTFRSGSSSGTLEKRITVRSNDPKHPAVSLTIRAEVQPMYVIEPPILNIGTIPRGTAAVREVTIRDAKGRPFNIKNVAVTHPDLQAAVTPIEGSNNSAYRLRLSLSPKRNAGPFNFSVSAQTDRPNAPQPAFLASGFVLGPVRVAPSAVYLGTVKDGQAFSPTKVTVTNSGPSMVEIKAIDLGDPALHATLSTNAPGRSFEIELSSSIMPTGWFHRTMRIHTSESDVPLEVSLSGVVLSPNKGHTVSKSNNTSQPAVN